ncbi:hypothetical protein [Curtobacterium sp. MCBD17_040]|uniref:hypothetical protein n=1 Tax=Curtobacterium sp. MCBD17_040 TaxID=2175674 RepID=UPI000DA8FFF1|nr:hypothetical protein [Curtobacterium sp. MCBD17_040]WIB65683.1 hypothetical protein DEI94_16310 [Curtobacterium sp. MCBD17_040]
MTTMTDTLLRNKDAGIADNGGRFAAHTRPTADIALTGARSTASQRLSATLLTRIDEAHAGIVSATNEVEDGRESGRAHALGEAYARLLFDEGNDAGFDYESEGETLLNDRVNGQAFSFDLNIDARQREEVVTYLQKRAAESYALATSGQEIPDVAAFHAGQYESFEQLASEIEEGTL